MYFIYSQTIKRKYTKQIIIILKGGNTMFKVLKEDSDLTLLEEDMDLTALTEDEDGDEDDLADISDTDVDDMTADDLDDDNDLDGDGDDDDLDNMTADDLDDDDSDLDEEEDKIVLKDDDSTPDPDDIDAIDAPNADYPDNDKGNPGDMVDSSLLTDSFDDIELATLIGDDTFGKISCTAANDFGKPAGYGGGTDKSDDEHLDDNLTDEFFTIGSDLNL